VHEILAGGKLSEWQRLDATTLRQRIHDRLFAGGNAARPPRITQEELTAALTRYPSYSALGSWHLRTGERGQPRNQRRIYFDVLPDGAPVLADYLAQELNARHLRFSLKVLAELSQFPRPASAVLYIDREDYAAARSIALAFAGAHPEALEERALLFAKPIAPGIAAADEPVPPFPPGDSSTPTFAEVRAYVVAEVVRAASPYAGARTLAESLRERLRHWDIDPARPWLRKLSEPDDL
jgi:hypothetical protein